MSIDTKYTPAIRNALLERMQDMSSRYAPDGGNRTPVAEGHESKTTTDQVQLSADAVRIYEAISDTERHPVFDAQRVAEIKHSIATGTFTVNPERIAEKFHDFNTRL